MVILPQSPLIRITFVTIMELRVRGTVNQQRSIYPLADHFFVATYEHRYSQSFQSMGAFHLVKISGISGSAVNGTRFVGSSHWKIPRKSGKSKKVGPFSRSCSIYVSRSLYQFQVHSRAPRHVPGFTTKWNNFLPIGNSTFATTEISGFFS